jgi:hypothetical protein
VRVEAGRIIFFDIGVFRIVVDSKTLAASNFASLLVAFYELLRQSTAILGMGSCIAILRVWIFFGISFALVSGVAPD